MNIPTAEESLYQITLIMSEILFQTTGFEIRLFSLPAEQFLVQGPNCYYCFSYFIDYAYVSDISVIDIYGNRISLAFDNLSETEVAFVLPIENFQSINNIIVKLDHNAQPS